MNTLFISDNVRKAVNEGRADYSPCFLSEIPLLFRDGLLPLDVALIHVSPPDEHGFCSFGVEVGVTKTAAQSAKKVIAQVNPNMPRTLGDAFIHVSKLDLIVPVDVPLPEVHMADSSELAGQIASHIIDLIPDGATLQTGIGGIPDAVLRRLGGKKHLGIHTELFSDGVIDLVERGVIDGEMKTLHPGKIVAGFILGTRRLFDYVHDNPIVELHPTEYINDPFVIAQNDRMVAINSAIEVDLTGQVCADSIGPRLYSGVGGQVDFIYGASRSKGGVPDHRLARDGHRQGRDRQQDRPHAQGRRRRRHDAQPRPLRGHRARRGGSLRQDHPTARPRPDRHRRAGVPGGAGEEGEGAQVSLTVWKCRMRNVECRIRSRGHDVGRP